MSTNNGDLLPLIGLLEGAISPAEGARLRERLAEEPALRTRMQKLRAVLDGSTTSTGSTAKPSRGSGLSEEAIAALVDRRLSERRVGEVEASLWESDPLLAEVISTYRFVRTPVDLPATRTRSTAMLFALFPEDAGTVDSGSSLRESSLGPLETPSVDPPSFNLAPPNPPSIDDSSTETTSPDETTRKRRLPAFAPVPPAPEGHPPAVSQEESEPTDERRQRMLVAIACGVGLLALIVGLASWPRGQPAPTPVVPPAGQPSTSGVSEPDDMPVRREPDPVEAPPPAPRADPFALVPKQKVAALFVLRDNRWSLVEEPLSVEEAESLVVPDDSWVAFEFAGDSFVLEGPSEITLRRPTPSDGHVRATLVRGRLAVRVPSDGSPVRVDAPPSSDNSDVDPTATTELITEGRDVSFAISSVDGRQELNLVEGVIHVDGDRYEGPRSAMRPDGGSWADSGSPAVDPPWRAEPTVEPSVLLLVNRLRGSSDVVETMLSPDGAVSRRAARWALELDEKRTIKVLVAGAEDDRNDALLFAIAARPARSSAALRAWQTVGQQIGNPHLGGYLAAWHDLATNGTPLDMATTTELIHGLGHEHVFVRSVAYRTLQAKTGTDIPYDPRGTPTDRSRDARAWATELRKQVPGSDAPP